MDFSHDTIKYIVIILALIIIGYTIFLLYKDAMNTRSELAKLKNNTSELTEIINEYRQLNEEDEDQSDTSETSYLSDEKVVSGRYYNQSNNILDQLILGSEQLQDLQQLQSEIEGTKLKSVIEEIEDDEEIQEQNEDNEDNEDNEEQNEEEENIEFITDLKKSTCESILKSGKNKGNTCKKVALDNSSYCKIHQSEA